MSTAVTEAPVKSEKSGKSSKSVNRFLKMSYFDLMNEASKSIENRRDLPIGRGEKKRKVRRFHLLDEEVAELKEAAKAGSAVPNPHNRGAYYYIWEALVDLGVNKWHEFKDVFARIRDLMKVSETKDAKGVTAWQRFYNKPSRSKENGLDAQGRMLQNIEVLQRVSPTSKTPYGFTVNQVAQDVLGLKGASIDIRRDNDKSPIKIMFNTQPEEFMTFKTRSGESIRIAIPRNDLKTRRNKDVPNVKIRKVSKPKDTSAKVTKPKVSKPRTPKQVEVSEPTETVVDVSKASDGTVVETVETATEVLASDNAQE